MFYFFVESVCILWVYCILSSQPTTGRQTSKKFFQKSENVQSLTFDGQREL